MIRRRPLVMGWVAHWPLLLALVMRVASESTSDLSYVVLGIYALLGRAHLLRALGFLWFFGMISPGLAAGAPSAAAGRYVVLFAAALSAAIHGRISPLRTRMSPLEGQSLFLGLFILAHAWLFSPAPDVSMLKAVSWVMATVTILSAWRGLSLQQRHELSEQFFWGLVLVMLLSLPLAATSIGYLTNGTGFQGILNQPQAMGLTMALLCAWVTARLLRQTRPSWLLLMLAGMSLLVILMSEARTAGVAAVLGVGLALLLGPGFAGRSILSMAPGLRSARVWMVFVVALLVSLIMAATFSDLVAHYITKSGRASAGGLWEAYEGSRGRAMDAMIDNIREHPWTGIGFGIASDPDGQVVSRDPFLGLPIGASAEKGVTPLMVVEELGIFGAVLVALWTLRLLRTTARGGIVPFAVVLTVLFLNFGEATLFSPGGFGLLPLILLGWAYAHGRGDSSGRYG